MSDLPHGYQMSTRIQGAPATLADLQKQADDLVAAIKALQAETKQPAPTAVSPIQPNTYVARLNDGAIALVTCTSDETSGLYLTGLLVDGWYTTTAFRPATNDEIKAHLIKEAEKRGIRVGVTVELDGPHASRTLRRHFEVGRFELRHEETNHNRGKWSPFDNEHWQEIKRPFLSAIQATTIEVPSTVPVAYLNVGKPALSITVDGHTYTPTFKEGYVEFGCAHIANDVILAAHELTSKHLFSQPVQGNRSVTSIRIGKGDFSPSLLKGLADEIRAREAAKDDGYDYYVGNDGELFGNRASGCWYIRWNRNTRLCEQMPVTDRTHKWTDAPNPSWFKLPNRAAVEALLRKATT